MRNVVQCLVLLQVVHCYPRFPCLHWYLYCFYLSCFSIYVGQSDIDLCHSLANLVGVVLGCPSNSNHLWYHLFSPGELHGTYMTGFMVLYGYQKVTVWPPFIHVLLTHHSTIKRLVMVVIAMMVEWNSLLRDSLVNQTT